MTITLYQLSKFFTYTAVFSVVIVMTSTFFPFIGGKYYFFRFTIELALVFLMLWWAFEAEPGVLEEKLRSMFRQPLFIAVSCFVLAVLLATLFAENPHGAFWSNYERGEGGFQMIHYYLFFMLTTLLFEKERDWRVLFYLSMAAAVGMVGYGLLAASRMSGFIGPYDAQNAPNMFAAIFSPNRFQGSLGNPAYVAPYLLFIIFYVLWRWVVEPNSRARHAAYGGLLLFYLVFFVLSQTRGAFLGLVAGAVALLAYLAFTRNRFRKTAAFTLGTFLVAGIVVYVLFSGKTQLENIPGGRLLNVSFSLQTAQTRFWTWESAWQGFLERPIFGWGPENFSTVFDKHFTTSHFVPGQNTETWFDRAHSVIFDYLAMTGAVGLLAYAGMFAVFYLLFFRAKKRLAEYRDAMAIEAPWTVHAFAWALLFALPVAYLVQGAILFDVLPIYINLFLFLAFANFLFRYPLFEPVMQVESSTGAEPLSTETVVLEETIVVHEPGDSAGKEEVKRKHVMKQSHGK